VRAFNFLLEEPVWGSGRSLRHCSGTTNVWAES
jgi:hypothetical protein